MRKTDFIKFRIAHEDHERVVSGRQAWCLRRLLKAGERGFTTVDDPAPRTSDYVHSLRKAGLNITMTRERHTGQYPGQHGRYRLVDEIIVLHDPEARH